MPKSDHLRCERHTRNGSAQLHLRSGASAAPREARSPLRARAELQNSRLYHLVVCGRGKNIYISLSSRNAFQSDQTETNVA